MKQDLLNKKNLHVYMVGIKGTGMTAFAELLQAHGMVVSGSDISDVFYTDAILESLQIPVFQGFSKQNIPDKIDLVIHSAAYSRETHVELKACIARGFDILEYTEALGEFSEKIDSSGVSGVHGKTTTTAMAGTIIKALGLPGSVLVGSGVSNFDGRSTFTGGDDFFIAETCEYRRHFLRFHPKRLILTSVEKDHLDYFKDDDDIDSAFVEYIHKLPEGGQVFYCGDDPGAVRVAKKALETRKDIQCIPYGFSVLGDYSISEHKVFDGFQEFSLPRLGKIRIQAPGIHNVRNMTAALGLVIAIYTDRIGSLSPKLIESIREAAFSFAGTKRRSELVGKVDGIVIMDDYAHHPTAIDTTLKGIRAFFPHSRIIVSFMSHTYSRTEALFSEFAKSFTAADMVLLHEIYASAREEKREGITGELLAEETKKYHSSVKYIEKYSDSSEWVLENLRKGDLFITMGAGDNWKLGLEVLSRLQGRTL